MYLITQSTQVYLLVPVIFLKHVLMETVFRFEDAILKRR